jgi:hypothetical protein
MAMRSILTLSVAVALGGGDAAATPPSKLQHSSHAVTARVERSRSRTITALCARGRGDDDASVATCIGDAPRVGAVSPAPSECPSGMLWAVKPNHHASSPAGGQASNRGSASNEEWLVFGGEFRSGAKAIQDSAATDHLALLALDRDGDGSADVKLTTEACTLAAGDCVSLFVRDPEWKMQRRFEFGCKQ